MDTAPMTESRYRRDNAALVQRLRKVEGQVRGVARMVEEDRYCIDVLVQIAAIRSALNAVGQNLIEGHVRHCVAKALQSGNGEHAIQELLDVLAQFTR